MATRSGSALSNATVVRIVAVVAASGLLLLAIYQVREVILLALVALFFAIGLDPAVRRLDSWGFSRGAAISTIFGVALLTVVVFLILFIPPMVRQIVDFARDLPELVQEFAEDNPRIQEWVDENDISTKLESAVSNIPSVIGSSFGSVLGIAGSVASGIFNLLTVSILTIYFSSSLLDIHKGTLKLIPKSNREKVSPLLDTVLEKIGGYIAGQVAVAVIAGLVAGIFLTIVKVPFSVALGLFVAFAALIPMVGATLGAVPATAVAFFGSVPKGLIVLGFFLLYQQLENVVIAPRIMTKAVDISPAAVLLSALIGGTLLGFVGALMAIPVAASIKVVFQEVVQPLTEQA